MHRSFQVSASITHLKKTLSFYVWMPGLLATVFLASIFLLSTAFPALAAPAGGQVVGGQADISQNHSRTTIRQQSNTLVINWESFNISSNESVSFQQPSPASSVLNRITDQNPTQIFGAIEANGRVFLSNPSGILFGRSATINTGSFVAAGLDIKVDDFMQGRYNFSIPEGQAGGIVINRGLIAAATGGSVSLIGGAVRNEGMILANMGRINLGAGRTVVMDFDGDGLLTFEVSEALLKNEQHLEAAVKNSGQIKAEGGEVLLTATTAQSVFRHVVNNTGIIEVGRIDNSGGLVRLIGIGSDSVIHSGVIDVSGKDTASTGGRVQILGNKVGLTADSSIDASGGAGGGTILIGGDFQGKNPAIQNASRTFVGKDASIISDARFDGNGGKIIVWADDATRFYGDISAKGRGDANEGGFAEVSGKAFLDFSGHVDLSSEIGRTGTLLLDPDELNITSDLDSGSENGEIAGTTPGPLDGLFDLGDGPVTSNLHASHLVSVLNDTNVTLNANTQIDIEVPVDASGNANSHSLTLDAPTLTFSDLADITLKNADLRLGNTMAGDVVLLDGATVVLSTGIGAGDLSIKGTVNGMAGVGTENLSLISGAGSTTLTGTVGNTVALEGLTLQANLPSSTGTVSLNGAVTANSLTTFAQNYAIAFNGDGTIATDTTFLNTGIITLGNDVADNLSFVGGLDTTNATTTNIAGSVSTTNTQMDLGAVTLIANTTLDAGNGVLNIAAVTGGNNALTIDNSGSLTFNGSLSGIGALTQSNAATGVTRFDGAVSLVSAALKGTTFNINNDFSSSAAFSATGDVTLASDITTTGADLTITGKLVIAEGASPTLSTGSVSAGAILISGTVNGMPGVLTEHLTLDSGTGTTTLTGALGDTTALGTLTIAQSGGSAFQSTVNVGTLAITDTTGTVSFNGAVTVNTFNTFPQNYGITFNAGGTITNNTTFLNTGVLTFGNDSLDSLTFAGGLDTTSATTTNIAGSVSTTATQMDFGPVALTADATLKSATGHINLQNGASGAHWLDIDAGSGGVKLAAVDVKTLDITSGILTLAGDITVDTHLDLRTNVNAIFLSASSITIDTSTGGLAQSIRLADMDGASALTINAGSGGVTLDKVGSTTAPLISLSVISTGQTLLGSDIVTQGAAGLNLSGASDVDLTTALSVNTSGGPVDLDGGAVDGNFEVSINAGGGTVTLGEMGQTAGTGLGGLFVVNASLDLGGNITINSGGTFDLSPTTISAIKLSGPLTLQSSGATVIRLPAPAMTGGQSLTIKTDSGLNFSGGTFETLTLETTGLLEIQNAITTSGNIAFTAATLTINKNLTADAGTGNITITENAGAGIGVGSGSATLGMSITGAELNHVFAGNLSLSTQGRIEVNDVTRAESDNIKSVTLEATGGTGSNITFTGFDSFFNALTAKANDGMTLNVNVSTTPTAPSFGSGDLILDADANNALDSDDGFSFGATGVGGLNFSGSLTLSAANSATGIELSNDFTFDSSSGNGNIDLGGVGINGDGLSPAPSLTVIAGGGTITLGNIGLVNPLSAILVNTTGTTVLKGNITINAVGGIDLSQSNNVSLLSDVSLNTSVGNGTVDLSNTAIDGLFSLNVDAGNGNVFLGNIGQTTALKEVRVSNAGGLILGGNINTQGVSGVNFLPANTINLLGPVIIDTSINNGQIQLSAVDGPFALTLNSVGGVVSLGAVGQTTPLASLTVTGNQTTLKGHITTQTAAGIDFSGITDIILSNPVILDTQINSGLVNFGSARVNGNHSLEIKSLLGLITLGSMGETTALASLVISSASRINLNNSATRLNTSGNIDFSAAPLEGNSNLIISAVAGDVSFLSIGQSEALGSIKVNSTGITSIKGNVTTQQAGGIDLSQATRVVLENPAEMTFDTITNNGPIQLNGGTLEGAVRLILNTGGGNVALGNMGQTTALTSLDVNSTGLTTLTGSIKTQGFGGIALTDATHIALSGTVVLESTAANGRIDLDGGVVDGNATLNIVTGSGTVKLGALGQTTGLKALSVRSGTLTLIGHITAGGGIDFSAVGQSTLESNILLNSAGNGGNTSLGATDGNFLLTVNAGSGAVTVGALGQTDALSGLTLISSGSTTLGGNITTQGAGGLDLSRASNIDLSTDLVIDSSAGEGGAVLLNGGAIDGASALTVNAGAGDITLGSLGANTALSSLHLINTGIQRYNDNLFVKGTLSLKGGTLVQNGSLNSAGGAINLEAASGITMASGASTTSNGGTITYTATTGDILLGLLDAHTGAVLIDASGEGSILNNRGSLKNITGDFTGVMNIKGNKTTLRAAKQIGLSTEDAITVNVPDALTLSFGLNKAYIRNIQSAQTTVEGGGEVVDVIKESRDANKKSESAIRQEFSIEAFNGEQKTRHLFTVNSPGFGTATEMGAARELTNLNPVVPGLIRTAGGWRFVRDSQKENSVDSRSGLKRDKKNTENVKKRSQSRQKYDKEISERFKEGFKYSIDPFSSKRR